ncbi:MAG: DUF4010 domain-containing protein, partial [Bacteroidaceae bacterium]|nr:DUF4010 domain-containing protein [Bacteroidaceae bacterium]
TLVYAGEGGLNVLSFISGLSDITPFILNLLQGSSMNIHLVVACTLQAIVSNITVNMCYALFFSGGKREMRPLILKFFGAVIIVNLILLGIFYLIS